MGITRDEFAQFKEWMQERHDEVMARLETLPCTKHQDEIAALKSFRIWLVGLASGIGAIVSIGIQVFFGMQGGKP